jgi:hypothetical protein
MRGVWTAGVVMMLGIGSLGTLAADGSDAEMEPWVEQNTIEGCLTVVEGPMGRVTHQCGSDTDWSHEFPVREGLRSLVMRMEWDPVDLGTTDRFEMHLWRVVTTEQPAPGMTRYVTHTYEQASGPSPVTIRVDAGDLGDEHDFDAIQDEWMLRIDVRPAPREPWDLASIDNEAVVILVEQSFTIHYDLHYLEHAPLEAIPDPWSEVRSWEDSLKCQVRAPTLGAGCFLGMDSTHRFTAGADLRSIVVALEWDSDDALMALGDEMEVSLGRLYQGEWPFHDVAYTHVYHQAKGSSPLEFRLDAGETGGMHDLAEMVDAWRFRFTVRAGEETDARIDQPFALHYHLFYGEHAPEGHSALPP